NWATAGQATASSIAATPIDSLIRMAASFLSDWASGERDHLWSTGIRSGTGVADDAYRPAVDTLNHLRSQDLIRAPIGGQSPAIEQDQPVRVASREIQAVGHEEDGHSRTSLFPELLEDGQLVSHIQRHGGF